MWPLIAQFVGQAMQTPQLPVVAPQQVQSDWPIIIATVAGLGVAGYVAYRVLR
jgi:hypothetical protein